MNNSFSVEKKVFEVLPDYCVGVIRTSIPNKEGAANAVSELFRKELQRFFHQSQGVALRETKNISAYRSALQKAGINPNISGTPAVVKHFRIKFSFSLAKQDLFA